MGNDLMFGLQLGVIGLGVTFLALGLLSLVMVLLQRVFPVKAAQPATAESQLVVGDDEQRLEEMAVALAVGICLLEDEGAFVRQDPALGKLLEETHSNLS